jgi:hypothetical protein
VPESCRKRWITSQYNPKLTYWILPGLAAQAIVDPSIQEKLCLMVNVAALLPTLCKGTVQIISIGALRLEEGKQAGRKWGRETEREEEGLGQSFEPTIFNVTKTILRQVTTMQMEIIYFVHYYVPDPQLGLLELQLKELLTLSTSNLDFLIDSWEVLVARYVSAIVDQLISVVYGIEKVFIDHGDASLHKRNAFNPFYKALEHAKTQLEDISLGHTFTYKTPMPAEVRPGQDAYFCRGAIRIINDGDIGRIERVRGGQLQAKDDERLKQSDGALLYWCCSYCPFKLCFHIPDSMGNSINAWDEILTHDGINLSYKPRFLVKSHLHQSIIRELSTVEPSQAPKYGCVFCFSVGKPLQQGISADPSATVFRSAIELAAHTNEHHRNPLPHQLLLQKFLVALEGKVAEGVRGWDVNFV